MEFGLFDGGGDGKYNGAGFVEISSMFSTHGAFFFFQSMKFLDNSRIFSRRSDQFSTMLPVKSNGKNSTATPSSALHIHFHGI